MTDRTLANILASVEIARIELEYANADLAAQGGAERRRDESGRLDELLAKLRLARVALAAVQDSLCDAAAGSPTRNWVATAS